MPLYEYRCTSCGYRFEKIQKVSDAPETACPKCGGELIRPLTAPALQFKGAGWYVNDYASKPSSSSGSEKPAEGSTSSESKPASTEAKPASSESSKPASSSSSPGTNS